MAVETITTVLAAAANYDLTDLETARDELGFTDPDKTDDDAFISRAITQVSAAISNYCNRVFALETLQDLIYIQQDPYPWQVPGGVYALQLSRWPLANSGVVAFSGTTHSSTVVDGIKSTAGIATGSLVFASDGSIPVGTTVKTVNPASLILSQAARTSVAGLSMTTGVQVVQTLSVGTTQTLVYGQDFTVDAKRGWLIRLDSFTGISVKWEAEPTTVIYQAGFDTVPADLEDACLRLVTSRFRAKGRDPMLVERSQGQMVGVERYWVGQAPGQKGAFAPEIIALIDQYRVPVAF